MKEESELMPKNYRSNIPSQVPYRNSAPLTNQVPYLSNVPSAAQDERWGFLPFVGGLALGGLLFNGGGASMLRWWIQLSSLSARLPTSVSASLLQPTLLSSLSTTSLTNRILWAI